MSYVTEKLTMGQHDYDLNHHGFKAQAGLVLACNGLGLKNILQAGQQWLTAHVNQVNRLNVFPVPDGDTGTNMALTMQAALRELERTADHRAGVLAAAAAHGALLGARGNSGLILAQFLAGLALGLKGQTTFTAQDFTRAVQRGVEQAYRSVVEPVEGTILTVSRAASEAACQSSQSSEDLMALFTAMVEAAKEAQRRTPELLPALKEAGVTDSGGQGFLYILEGSLRFMRHEPVVVDPAGEITLPPLLKAGETDYGYDLQFLLYGEQLDVMAIRADLERMGESLLVAGDTHRVKVHLHVADPRPVLSYGAKLGLVTGLVVEDMTIQVKAFANQGRALPVQSPIKSFSQEGVIVAVAPGKGFVDIFQSLGVDHVILREQSVFPGVQSWLNLIDEIEADRLIVLPDHPQIFSTISQLQPRTGKHIVSVSKTAPEGIAAALPYNPRIDFETNLLRMAEAVQRLRTIEVRDDQLHGRSDEHAVVLEILAKMESHNWELATIYFGQSRSQVQAERLAGKINERYPDIRLEVYDGGQTQSFYIISLE